MTTQQVTPARRLSAVQPTMVRGPDRCPICEEHIDHPILPDPGVVTWH